MSQLNWKILAIARCNTQYRSEKMAAFDLKACHTSYLMHVCANPGISQDRLAQLIFINKSNVARQVAVLEEEGYIRREPSQADRRAMELYPTDKALALLPQIQQLLGDWEQLITEDVTQEEMEIATRVLEKMRQKAADWMGDR